MLNYAFSKSKKKMDKNHKLDKELKKVRQEGGYRLKLDKQ